MFDGDEMKSGESCGGADKGEETLMYFYSCENTGEGVILMLG